MHNGNRVFISSRADYILKGKVTADTTNTTFGPQVTARSADLTAQCEAAVSTSTNSFQDLHQQELKRPKIRWQWGKSLGDVQKCSFVCFLLCH